MKKLRLQWRKFADEYIKTGNVYQSAINAGYSENYARTNAYKLLEKDSIKSYIDERMKKLEEEAIADQAEVLKYLTRVLRDEEREDVLVNIGNYEQEIQSMKVSAKDRIKAAELLGKRYGSWTDKVDMTLDVPTIISGADELED